MLFWMRCVLDCGILVLLLATWICIFSIWRNELRARRLTHIREFGDHSIKMSKITRNAVRIAIMTVKMRICRVLFLSDFCFSSWRLRRMIRATITEGVPNRCLPSIISISSLSVLFSRSFSSIVIDFFTSLRRQCQGAHILYQVYNRANILLTNPS